MTSNDERVAHLRELLALPLDDWPTRDCILYEASRLIAAKGYHGATTRDIAEAVGIRQPSLFNHFASKQEILKELLEFDLAIPAERAQEIAAEGGSSAIRLYRYVLWDIRWYYEMPFNLRGLQEELLDEPAFEVYRELLDRWKGAVQRIVREGVASKEFHGEGAEFVPSILTALSWEVIRTTHGNPSRRGAIRSATNIASFVLRALLRDPERLDAVRAEGERSDDTVKRGRPNRRHLGRETIG